MMFCKVYSLTFEFLRANDQESLIQVQKMVVEKIFAMEKYCSSELERIRHLSSSNNNNSYPVTVAEIVSHFKWSSKQSKVVF